MLRVAVCCPPPHGLEQFDHGDQFPTIQSRGCGNLYNTSLILSSHVILQTDLSVEQDPSGILIVNLAELV